MGDILRTHGTAAVVIHVARIGWQRREGDGAEADNIVSPTVREKGRLVCAL